jgi:hypothetical protein
MNATQQMNKYRIKYCVLVSEDREYVVEANSAEIAEAMLTHESRNTFMDQTIEADWVEPLEEDMPSYAVDFTFSEEVVPSYTATQKTLPMDLEEKQ